MYYFRIIYELFDRSIDVLGGKRISIYDELSDNFIGFYFRGTCLSIDEFDNMHGFHFEKEPVDFNIDKLILLCEYIENMLMGYQGTFSVSGYGYMAMTARIPINIQFYMMQIGQVIEKIGYMRANKDGLSIFVEKSSAAIAVAEIVPKKLSYKVISNNHYTMKGNLNAKKETLFAFMNLLEPQREKMSSIDNKFSSEVREAVKKQLSYVRGDIRYLEGFLRRSKRCFGMGLIVTKLETTQLTSVALSVFVSNLFRIQRRICVVIFSIRYKFMVCVA